MRKTANGADSRKKVRQTRRASSLSRSPLDSFSAIGDNRRGSPLHRKRLDYAIQRYADLYDLAPTGYVSFNRSGRIEEINLTAAQLFGMPRDHLFGMPFLVFVLREDTSLF